MSLLQRAVKSLGGVGLVVAFPAMIYGQPINSTNYYSTQASEYAPAGILPGDQVNPSLSLQASGGFLVWQDNITDGDGLGISAVRLDSTFSPTLGVFRVNQQGASDQENPAVALLAGGGAAFVWQGGTNGFQHIFARFLSAGNIWVTGDIQVNTAPNFQVNPVLAVLNNSNVVVTWGSVGQDNADGFQGVYAQVLSPAGQKVGGEFQVNQFTPFNQRNPAVASFPNGGFIVTWVSEEQQASQGFIGSGVGSTGYNSVDIYARLFDSGGNPLGGEFLVSGSPTATSTNICANPSVAVGSDGSYTIAWSQKNIDLRDMDASDLNNSWDVFARQFNAAGVGGAAQVVNSQRFGNQYAPRVVANGTDYMVVWTSEGQDGSREGVYSQILQGNGTRLGGEQLVNTLVLNAQKFQTVASDSAGRFLVVWSSFINVANGMDLRAQRYASTLQALSPPGAPSVIALDSYSLSVTWPPLAGFSVSYYELFVDNSSVPDIVTNNLWSDFNFDPGTPHTFQLAYVLTDGRVSPLSTAATGTTWGQDRAGYGGAHNPDGLPDDWETRYYGSNLANWPKLGGFTVLAPGVTVEDVFNWGADPTNPSTWMRQWITRTSEGLYLNWNTVPGGIYQVLSTSNLKTWTPLGSPRFEAGTTDSLFLGAGTGGYYQIVRNRY